MATLHPLLYTVSLLLLFSCSTPPVQPTAINGAKAVLRDDFDKYYKAAHVEGCFVLYDDSASLYTFCNRNLADKAYTPASTFKICNSLIGLETGVIPDEHFSLPWNGVKNDFPGWNHDQDMAEAIKNSTVWYYQELARRVGGKRMKYWLDTIHYGNADTSGGIDKFWLHGGLKITPLQQISLLKGLHDNILPVSRRSMDIVKDILILNDSAGVTLRGKTGWAVLEKEQVGWFVGYVERHGRPYYFANCIHSNNLKNPAFVSARKGIALQILTDLRLLGI